MPTSSCLPPRFIVVAGLLILSCFSLVRLGLLLFNGDLTSLQLTDYLKIFSIGAIYDLAVTLWLLLPLMLSWLILPATWINSRRWVVVLMLGMLAIGLMLVAISEFVFWNEFASRFNFIAVDYLIYSREVLGNIRESYRLTPLLLLLFTLATLFWFGWWRKARHDLKQAAPAFKTRFLSVFALIAVASLLTWPLNSNWKNVLNQPQKIQLAGNGIWEFLYAFRYNEIDFERNYQTIAKAEAIALAQQPWANLARYRLTHNSKMPIERQVLTVGPAKPVQHVVLISMESQGAEYVAALGGKPLTPYLEQLGQQGILFKHVYATGTRTVRGLEALTLSVPPTPGQAILMRPNNQNLFTLGGVFKQQGFTPMYFYGGYSYFDNMRQFFSGNGYQVIDRSDIAPEKITHETIWGVADENLYDKVLSELDAQSQQGKHIFAHVMTTSNHRPFTYPNGKIDVPSGSGREGAVKYADFALGQFIAQAKQHAWFDQTLFVIVADHTSIARGRSDLPLEKYHIPLVFYAPKMIQPMTMDGLMSQIDVAPTLLGWLNMPYTSQFFGRDVLHDNQNQDSPIYLANYQTVGLVEAGYTIELKPQQQVSLLATQWPTPLPPTSLSQTERQQHAVANYQLAAELYSGRSIH